MLLGLLPLSKDSAAFTSRGLSVISGSFALLEICGEGASLGAWGDLITLAKVCTGLKVSQEYRRRSLRSGAENKKTATMAPTR